MTSVVARLTNGEAAAAAVMNKVGLAVPKAKSAWMKSPTALNAGRAMTPAVGAAVNDAIAATGKAATGKAATGKAATGKAATGKAATGKAVIAVAGVVAVKAAGQKVAIRSRPRAIHHALAWMSPAIAIWSRCLSRWRPL
jgi:hypothetical protein